MRYRTTLYIEDELNFKVQRFLNQYHENTGVRLSKNKFIEALILKAMEENRSKELQEKIVVEKVYAREIAFNSCCTDITPCNNNNTCA